MYHINENGDLVVPRGDLLHTLIMCGTDPDIYESVGALCADIQKFEKRLKHLEFRISSLEDGG